MLLIAHSLTNVKIPLMPEISSVFLCIQLLVLAIDQNVEAIVLFSGQKFVAVEYKNCSFSSAK